MMAVVLLLESTIGVQIGARISNNLKADQLKILLAILVLAVMSRMLLQLLIHPHVLDIIGN